MADSGESSAPVVAVRARRGRRLHFSWGTGDELRLCDVQKNPSAAPDSSPSTSHVMQWGVPGVTQRRVAYDSLHLFQEQKLRSRAQGDQDAEWWRQVLDYSRKVSAVLGRMNDPMDKEALSLPPEEEEELGLQRAVWELIEFFYVDHTETNGIAAEDLVQWLQRNASALQLPCTLDVQQLLPALEMQPSPELNGEYWRVLLSLVALGWTSWAIDLLGLHSAWSQPEGRGAAASPQVRRVLEAVEVLLKNAARMKRATLPDPTGGRAYASVAQFDHHRKGWLEQCAEVLRDTALWEACSQESPETSEGLQRVLHALCGNEQVLEEATGSWVELLAAEMLHKYPKVKRHGELRTLVDRCMARKDGGEGVLDQLLLAVMDHEVQEVARICSNNLGNWMMAHVTELLSLAGSGAAEQLARALPAQIGGDQVEFYRLEYVASLMPHAITWRVAASYLAWCPVHGATVLEELLGRQPVASHARLPFKVLSVCEQYGLHSTSAAVCRLMGMDAWRRRHVVSAVKWLQRAHDDRRLSSMAAQLETRVVRGLSRADPGDEEGELEQLQQVLDSLGGELRSGGAMAFVHQCRALRVELRRVTACKRRMAEMARDEFGGGEWDAQVEEELEESSAAARDAIMSLLCGPAAPRRLWATILFQAVPLLEGARLVFSAHETQELIARLQEMSLSHCAEYLDFPGDPGLTPAAQLQVVRLALARNLSRALVAEASGGTMSW